MRAFLMIGALVLIGGCDSERAKALSSLALRLDEPLVATGRLLEHPDPGELEKLEAQANEIDAVDSVRALTAELAEAGAPDAKVTALGRTPKVSGYRVEGSGPKIVDAVEALRARAHARLRAIDFDGQRLAVALEVVHVVPLAEAEERAAVDESSLDAELERALAAPPSILPWNHERSWWTVLKKEREQLAQRRKELADRGLPDALAVARVKESLERALENRRELKTGHPFLPPLPRLIGPGAPFTRLSVQLVGTDERALGDGKFRGTAELATAVTPPVRALVGSAGRIDASNPANVQLWFAR